MPKTKKQVVCAKKASEIFDKSAEEIFDKFAEDAANQTPLPIPRITTPMRTPESVAMVLETIDTLKFPSLSLEMQLRYLLLSDEVLCEHLIDFDESVKNAIAEIQQHRARMFELELNLKRFARQRNPEQISQLGCGYK